MISHGKDIKIFTGNANPKLAADICKIIGTKLGESEVKSFADGEASVSLYETVRGSDVFLVQSTCKPVNDSLMELLIMVDACRRASAGRITAVMPYFGYARQDRKAKSRDPHLRQARGQHARRRRRRPCADDGPARQPDPGLLRYPRG